MLGLNDNIDEGLVNDSPNTPMGVDPTKTPPQEFSQVKLPSEVKMGKLDKIISISDPELEYKPPTKEELFGQDVVANQVPTFDKEVKIKDELTKLNDLRYGQSLIYNKGSISQEDIQTLDNVYKGSLINDDNLLGFYTKHASKTQYTQTLKQVNDLINKKFFILNENYQKYLQVLKESCLSFKSSFQTNSKTIKGYVSMITTERETVIKSLIEKSSNDDKVSDLCQILTSYTNEFDVSTVTNSSNIVDNYNQLKTCLSTQCLFFKSFMDLHYKKDITVINSNDIKSKLYHDDTRYSLLDIVDFIIHQLPYLEPVVLRTIDKTIINIDTIANNYLNSAPAANDKIDVISKNQNTLDEIEQELNVFERIVKESIEVCKTISLIVTAIESESDIATQSNVSSEGFLDSLKHGIMRMVSDEDKIQQSIQKMASKVDSKRQKTSLIKQPGWGGAFSVSSKNTVGYEDVRKLIQNLDKTLRSSEYNKAIDEIIDVYKKVTTALEKHIFSANGDIVTEISDNIEKANDIAEHALSYIDLPNGSKNTSNFKTLDSSEANQLTELLTNLMDNKALEGRVRALENIIDECDKAISKADESKFYQEAPQHIKAAKMVLGKLKPAIGSIFKAFGLRKKYAYSTQEYIRSSFS